MRQLCIVLLFLFALGQGPVFAQLVPPRIGLVSDLTGALRPVIGVSGNFLMGDPVARSVLSAACSGTFSFVKTETTLSILDGVTETDFPSPAGPALFSFFGHAGFAFFPSDGSLRRWDGVNLNSVALDAFTGDVLALAQSDANHVWLAVRQSDAQVYVLLFDGISGALQSSTPLTNASGSIALLNGQEFLYTSQSGLMLHRANGLEIAFSAPGIGELAGVHFELLGANWWSVKASGQHFAIRTEPGRESLYRLPESAPSESTQ